MLTDAAVFAAGEIALFTYYERRAESLGRNLGSYIDAIPASKKLAINLIGHSFGARVIHYALGHNDWSGYNIKDCLFLGGAADVDSDNWQHCLTQIKGTLFNAYSKKDLALKLTPDFRKRVGRHPIAIKSPRIVNRHYPSFKHSDYWPRLGYILKRLWRDFAPSAHVKAPSKLKFEI